MKFVKRVRSASFVVLLAASVPGAYSVSLPPAPLMSAQVAPASSER